MVMLLLGWCMLLYGVTELVNAMKFYQDKKKLQSRQSNAEEITTEEQISE